MSALPAGWRIATLSDVAEVRTGLAKASERKLRDPLNVPYMRVANVQDGYLDLREVHTIDLERSHLKRFSLEAGDVLLTEGGDFDKLGRGSLWRASLSPCVHQNHVFAVRTSRDLLPGFLSSYCSSRSGKRYFLSCSKQTTNLASINASQLRAMPLPLPPLAEQRCIVEILDNFDRAIAQTERLIAAKRRRFRGVLVRFSSEHYDSRLSLANSPCKSPSRLSPARRTFQT